MIWPNKSTWAAELDNDTICRLVKHLPDCNDPLATLRIRYPDSKVHGAYMGPTRDRQDPGGPHVGPMTLVIWVSMPVRSEFVRHIYMTLGIDQMISSNFEWYITWRNCVIQNGRLNCKSFYWNIWLQIHLLQFCSVSDSIFSFRMRIEWKSSQAGHYCKYRQVSNIRCTLVGSWIVDHSDVVGTSPIGTASTTSSFST